MTVGLCDSIRRQRYELACKRLPLAPQDKVRIGRVQYIIRCLNEFLC